MHKNDQLSAHLMHFNNDGILRHITIKENPINLSTMTKDIIRLYNSNLNIPTFLMLVSFLQNSSIAKLLYELSLMYMIICQDDLIILCKRIDFLHIQFDHFNCFCIVFHPNFALQKTFESVIN